MRVMIQLSGFQAQPNLAPDLYDLDGRPGMATSYDIGLHATKPFLNRLDHEVSFSGTHY